MKKVRRLRKWVVDMLLLNDFILLILLSGECENLRLFVISKLILLFIFIFNNIILFKNTDFLEN